jgi:hypothetical protein
LWCHKRTACRRAGGRKQDISLTARSSERLLRLDLTVPGTHSASWPESEEAKQRDMDTVVDTTLRLPPPTPPLSSWLACATRTTCR